MIKIYGVNDHQKDILDKLWKMESLEEIDDWVDELDDEEADQVRLMQELVMFASMDNLIESEADCEEAIKIIKQIENKLTNR